MARRNKTLVRREELCSSRRVFSVRRSIAASLPIGIPDIRPTSLLMSFHTLRILSLSILTLRLLLYRQPMPCRECDLPVETRIPMTRLTGLKAALTQVPHHVQAVLMVCIDAHSSIDSHSSID
jgi:hypothetical protein